MASDEQKLPASVRTARDLLAKAVEKAGIQISGGLASDAKIPLEDIFVNLTLLTKDELSKLFGNESSSFSSGSERARQLELFSEAQPQRVASAERERGIELEDIFSATNERSCNQGATTSPGCDHEVADSGLLVRAKEPVEANKKKVLAFGSAGCGKSTIFLIMLEYLWSKGELWRGKFDLVLAVELRRAEVQTATSLCDLLARRFSSLDVETDELLEMSRFFRSNQSRLCIVLDGLDECKLKNCSEYMRDLLLTRRSSGDMHVVVTSRPCTAAHTLSHCGEYEQQVEVVGFSPDDVETYVIKVMGDVKGEAMLEKLRSQEGTMSLMGTPLFAALACELFMDDTDGSKLPTSSTELYESLVRRVMERRVGKRYKTLSAIKMDEIEVLKELSGFALSMLAQQKMVFNEEDVSSAQLSMPAIELGLLRTYKSTSSTEDRQYRFAHLSFQEVLAAWYVRSEMLNDENDAAWLVRRVGHYSGHMTMFWRFLIALAVPKLAVAIMEHLWRIICDRAQRAYSKTDTRLLDDIVSRSQPGKQSNDVDRIHAVLKSALSIEKIKELADQLLVGTAGQGRGRHRVDNALPQDRELTDELYLDTLVVVWKNEAAERSAEVFLSAVRKVDPGTASHCEQHAMTSATSEISTPSSSGAAPTATAAPSPRPAKDKVERRCLADLLVAYLEHCQYQGMSSCNGHCSFFSNVFILNFVKLSLLDCTAVAHFLTTHSCVDVPEVYLQGCLSNTANSAMRCILNGLARYTHVRVLSLNENHCTDGNVFSSAILSASSSLEEVRLDQNEVGIDGFALVCRALSSCSKLRIVTLCGLWSEFGADASLTTIQDILQSNRNLEGLYVLGYAFTYGPKSEERRVLAQFRQAVRQCSKLSVLCFSAQCGDNSRLRSKLQPLLLPPRHRKCRSLGKKSDIGDSHQYRVTAKFYFLLLEAGIFELDAISSLMSLRW
ncbi:uncharacterized protein LOC135820874 [Sycon ciliatum]|uniref:uncharacterized protein LOC135820874 n=1 Tax=Sycon ciliatum TaxID=27933 RepID=UPI0031F6EC3C